MARLRVIDTGAQRLKVKLDDWAASPTNRGDVFVYDPGIVDGTESQKYAFNIKNMLVKIEDDEGPFKRIIFVEILGS